MTYYVGTGEYKFLPDALTAAYHGTVCGQGASLTVREGSSEHRIQLTDADINAWWELGTIPLALLYPAWQGKGSAS